MASTGRGGEHKPGSMHVAHAVPGLGLGGRRQVWAAGGRRGLGGPLNQGGT